MSIVVDRSMTKQEYMRWRKEARYHRRYDCPHWSDWDMPAIGSADYPRWQRACERTARQIAMEIRIYRNKGRHGLL